jgi:hypothetical protein
VTLLATFQAPAERKVRLCTLTNEAAGPFCPSTYAAMLAPEEDLPTCTAHYRGWDQPERETHASAASFGEETIRYVGNDG